MDGRAFGANEELKTQNQELSSEFSVISSKFPEEGLTRARGIKAEERQRQHHRDREVGRRRRPVREGRRQRQVGQHVGDPGGDSGGDRGELRLSSRGLVRCQNTMVGGRLGFSAFQREGVLSLAASHVMYGCEMAKV